MKIRYAQERIELTWDEWKRLGYHVEKGQKSCGRNEYNVPVFHDKQVAMDGPKRTYDYAGYLDRYYKDHPDPWAEDDLYDFRMDDCW